MKSFSIQLINFKSKLLKYPRNQTETCKYFKCRKLHFRKKLNAQCLHQLYVKH